MTSKLTSFLRRAMRSTVVLYAGFALLCYLEYQHLSSRYRVAAIQTATENVRTAILEIESSQRGYLLTHKAIYLSNYKVFRAVLKHRLEVLCHLIPATQQNQYTCRTLDQIISTKLAEMQATVDLETAGKHSEALSVVATDQGYELMNEIQENLTFIDATRSTGKTLHACIVP